VFLTRNKLNCEILKFVHYNLCYLSANVGTDIGKQHPLFTEADTAVQQILTVGCRMITASQ
jgi:hypothetical protein